MGFDIFEGNFGVFDGVVEDASDDGVFVHVPFFEDFFDGKGMNDVWFACLAGLAFVCFGGEGDGLFDLGGIVHGFIIRGGGGFV